MENLTTGLETIAAFLLTPVVVIWVLLYCEMRIGRMQEPGLRIRGRKAHD
jgi:hypothetical protein